MVFTPVLAVAACAPTGEWDGGAAASKELQSAKQSRQCTGERYAGSVAYGGSGGPARGRSRCLSNAAVSTADAFSRRSARRASSARASLSRTATRSASFIFLWQLLHKWQYG